MNLYKLRLLLGEAADFFGEVVQIRSQVEEARSQAREVLECEPRLIGEETEPSINTIFRLVLDFIPLVADLISASGKLLSSDPSTAIPVLSKAVPWLQQMLIELDLTQKEIKYRAPEIIFDRGE